MRTGKLIDLTGQRFGKWLVTGHVSRVKGCTQFECTCECGTVRNVAAASLRQGTSRGCGCERPPTNLIHGMSNTSEHSIWRAMMKRCHSPSSAAWHLYGGAGIAVCDRWRNSFVAFYSDMGPRPTPRHSIDRYPNQGGNYEPSNCRWATPIEQGRNTKRNKIVVVGGRSMPLSEAVSLHNVKYGVALYRLKVGKSIEEALGIKAGE